jgi:uncharacterized protein (TIGR03083 family)
MAWSSQVQRHSVRSYLAEEVMALSPADVMSGILDELESFEALVRDLDSGQLATPTRCDGWTVRDVAAHVIGSLAEVTAGRPEGLGAAEVNERVLRERRGHTGSQLADELAAVRAQAAALLGSLDLAAWLSPAPGGHRGTLVDGVETLWHDAFVHGDDIRAAVGLPSVEGPGLGAACRTWLGSSTSAAGPRPSSS